MTRARHSQAIVAALLILGGCTSFKRCVYEGFGRDDWQQPEAVVDALALPQGARVADLGAGGGYFTYRLADAVGPDGRVYAVDIDEGMLDYLRERSEEEGVLNVEVVRAEPDDPRLPEASVDLIFSCNTYHHLSDRVAYFAGARSALRPGGRIAIVELERKGWLQWVFPHSTERAQIVAEMEQAGYQLAEGHDFLSRQSFLVFDVAR